MEGTAVSPRTGTKVEHPHKLPRLGSPVTFTIVDVLGQATGVAPAVLAAVAAIPVARLDEARLVAVLVAHPALVAARCATLLPTVATIVVALRRLAFLLCGS